MTMSTAMMTVAFIAMPPVVTTVMAAAVITVAAMDITMVEVTTGKGKGQTAGDQQHAKAGTSQQRLEHQDLLIAAAQTMKRSI